MLNFHHIRWALRTAWHINARLTFAYFASALLRAVLPVLQVIASRFLINDVVALIQANTTDASSLIGWLLILVSLSMLDLIALLIGGRYLLKRLEDTLNTHIASDVMAHAYRLPLSLFENLDFQDTLERAQQNIALNFTIFLRAFVEAGTGIIRILSLLAVLIVIEPLMVLIAIVAIPPYTLIMGMVSRRRYQNEFQRAPNRRWTRYFTELMLNRDSATDIRLLGIGETIVARFRQLMADFESENKQVEQRALVAGIIFVVITLGLFFGLFYRVLERVLLGALTIGDVAILGGAIARLSSTAESVVAQLGLALERSLHVANLRTYLDIPTDDTESPSDTQFNLIGRIEFRDVTFTYPDNSEPTLSNVSFVIEPGETVAIVGENGVGKSTIVKLLARIYAPDSGSIWLDDTPLELIPHRTLYHHIAVILQEFGRYEATVADNIAYGNSSEYLNQPDKVEALARELEIHTMIESMPDGYDTFLGRRFGKHVPSGGQWQQLAIARALARDATYLILDEPTANLDARTEHTVFSRFAKLAEGRTTLLISHRFSTVSMADRILVLHNGQIVEAGTHDELLQHPRGQYAQLYHLHMQRLGG